MPLPSPDCARQASHQRSIIVRSYRCGEGLWDVWPEPVPRAGGMLPAGEDMHAMWLSLTVERTATIVAVQAVTDAGPYGGACGAITPDYQQLVGVRVARGYRDAIRRLFGRTAGCTHINELAAVMGSAVQQALWGELSQPAMNSPSASTAAMR